MKQVSLARQKALRNKISTWIWVCLFLDQNITLKKLLTYLLRESIVCSWQMRSDTHPNTITHLETLQQVIGKPSHSALRYINICCPPLQGKQKVAWFCLQKGIMDFVWRESNVRMCRKQGLRAARGMLPPSTMFEIICVQTLHRFRKPQHYTNLSL